MDPTRAAHATDLATHGEVEGVVVGSSPAPMTPHVADTMRRVHAQRRNGAAPSYESLMALGLAASG
jgi:hypothetical protein